MHSPPQLQAPVLFIIFNRPEITSKTFEAIRRARPRRLYIASDGPRQHVAEDVAKVKATRTSVSNVDWPCAVQHLYRDTNLGCRRAVSGALNWFFTTEDRGIILEDDVLPEPGFFEFCDKALQHYEHNLEVAMVSGQSLQGPPKDDRGVLRVRFSSFALIWGWATWRRTWVHYDVDLKTWSDVGEPLASLEKHPVASRLFVKMWSHIFSATQKGAIDTWDYQLNHLLFKAGQKCVLPPYNLVSNLGYGRDATHTRESPPKWLVAPHPIDVERLAMTTPQDDPKIDKEINFKIFRITAFSKIKFHIRSCMPFSSNAAKAQK